MSYKSGSCLCGSIKVKLNDKPQKIGYCYCKTCRRLSGSVGQLAVMFDSSAVEIEDPRHHERVYVDTNTDSGKPNNIKFCSTCSVVYASVPMGFEGNITVVRPSALDIPGWEDEFEPDFGVHTQERCKWTNKIATL